MVWTEFNDMYSGGSAKTDWGTIYIELPESEAVAYFENRFDRNPRNVTCDCCGRDYWIEEVEFEPVEKPNVLIIRKGEI